MHFVEISTDAHSHYHQGSASLNSIDKTFVCTPACLLAMAQVSAFVEGSPVLLSDQGISDHAPIIARFSVSARSPQASAPIHKFVCKSFRFKELITCYICAANLSQLCDSVRTEAHKLLILDCARLFRNEMHMSLQ